ncbi:MAG: alpha-1,2-fucosyltransferase [Chitinophagaceae bacterium]|nr:alpha-1,2-fucosyltransferase [Chitinophagaceae bacterium]
MIIARLQGGLGNQLFQYAATKALAEKLSVPFKFDAITSLQKDKQRKIALHDFQASFELAAKNEIKKFVFFPSLYRHSPSFFANFGKHIYREPHFHFDQYFFRLTDPVFLDGFWQSPLYFKDIEDIIRQDFLIKENLIKNVKELGKELENRNSVAVHVRRGDFLTPKASMYHGVMDEGYYEKAITLIKEKQQEVSVYYFSDDTDWVKRHLQPHYAGFVSPYTLTAIEDFYLMTRCRHNIIANSSFSWWTAWLNNHPGKMVVAPKKWLAKDQINTGDLIPSNWFCI